MSNKIKYPEAWDFYIEQARNIEEELDINHLGNYRIPKPHYREGFIYSNTPMGLWRGFKEEWDKTELVDLYNKINFSRAYN